MGVSGVEVAGYPEPQVMFALVVQFTTDMPAGNAVARNCERSGRFTDFAGVRAHERFWYPPYQPPYDPSNSPPSKSRRFDVQGDATTRRTATSVAGSVAKMENVRRAG